MGLAAASGRGVEVASVAIALLFVGAAIALYRADPIKALFGLWIVVIINTPASAVVGYSSTRGEAIRQGDELLVLLFAGMTLLRLLRSAAAPPPLRYLVITVGVACFGIVSAVLHSVPVHVAGTGAWLGLKFWVMVWVTLALPWTRSDIPRVYAMLTRVGGAVAGIGLIDYVTHGAVSRSLHTAVSYNAAGTYRANAEQSILATPGEYSLFMSLLFAVALSRLAVSRDKKDAVFVILFAVSAILSLRLKGVLSLGMVLLIVAVVESAYSPRNVAVILAVAMLLGAAVYSLEKSVISKQVTTYTSAEATPRAKLYAVSQRIAARDFPFGVGFGRYASYPSRLYYSPVYREYGLNVVWGLSPSYPKFIDDTSWPSVIGETGYGGFAVYVVGLLILVAALLRALRRAVDMPVRWVPLAALCALGVLMVDSLGDPTLFDWVATTSFALVLGPALMPTLTSRSGDASLSSS